MNSSVDVIGSLPKGQSQVMKNFNLRSDENHVGVKNVSLSEDTLNGQLTTEVMHLSRR